MSSVLLMHQRSLTTVVFVFAMSALFSQAAPLNDNFTNSIPIIGTNISVTGSFVGGTVEPNEIPPEASGMSGLLTIWYSWVAPASGRANIDTVPFSISQRICVYVGTDLANLKRVPFVPRTFFPSFLVTEGTVYHLQIGGSADNGDTSVTLNLELRSEVSSDNDDFSEAALLRGLGFNVWTFGTPMPALHWVLGATTEIGEPAHRDDGPSKSLWWKWVAPVHGRLSPDTRPSSASNIIGAIYHGPTLQALTLLGKFTNLTVLLCR